MYSVIVDYPNPWKCVNLSESKQSPVWLTKAHELVILRPTFPNSIAIVYRWILTVKNLRSHAWTIVADLSELSQDKHLVAIF